MAVIWTTDAYASGDLTAFTAQQEVSADRYTCIAPPGEVGGGPQSRAFIGKCRIVSGDAAIFGTGNNRCEVTKQASAFDGRTTQGGAELWEAFEVYFGDPGVVSDTNAYHPPTGTGTWNHFHQWHQQGGLTTQPFSLGVSYANGLPTVFNCWTRGGNETSPTSIITHNLGDFEYGWHEFRWYMKFGQAGVGRSKVWIDDVVKMDYTGPIGYNPDSTGQYTNYLKVGCYRGASLINSTVFHAGIRFGTTEADILAGGGTDPPPDPDPNPDALTRDARFGKITVGGGRRGFSADNKRGSRFTTGIPAGQEADVADMHIFVEGSDASASTQKITLGIYDDDGPGSTPMTKYGEADVELTIAGDSPGAWRKVTLGTPIRILGNTVWLIAQSGTPANRLAYATDSVANAMAYAADTYDVAAPRMADPFGAASLESYEVSICADYDLVSAADTTGPVLQGGAVNGTSVFLGYDEPLDTTSVPNASDYAVEVNGVARAVSSVAVSGSNVQFEIESAVVSADTVTVSYTGVTGRKIRDLSLNSADDLVDEALENQTSEENQSQRIDTIVRTTSIARISSPSSRIAGLGGGGI